eukprot:TRINITY_DN5877_c0_g1_i1.p1 TRINITY_DN5877_c0_g1~~TRINITY_DN5877_c0_g1_i1.p1  ORF type:complete len:208 (-),score=10.31 TRINITY_DN5877_c0_g1_i1:23-646(-)
MAHLGKRTRADVEVESGIVGGESALLGLPDELLELISLRLPMAAVVALGACCVRLRGITSSDAIWRPRYENDFPRLPTSPSRLGWRDAYQRSAARYAYHEGSVGFRNTPKRPLSAYFLFMADNRDAIQKANPKASTADLARLLGEAWRNIESTDKKKYEILFARQQAGYEKAKVRMLRKIFPSQSLVPVQKLREVIKWFCTSDISVR